jgi:hypothetical protein
VVVAVPMMVLEALVVVETLQIHLHLELSILVVVVVEGIALRLLAQVALVLLSFVTQLHLELH